MNVRKLNTGNYYGWFKGYYFFIYRRPHGKWCVVIGRKGEWLLREGYHGTSLPTIVKAKTWAKNQINNCRTMNVLHRNWDAMKNKSRTKKNPLNY